MTAVVVTIVMLIVLAVSSGGYVPASAQGGSKETWSTKPAQSPDITWESLCKPIDYSYLLGLTKPEVLTRLAPKHKGKWLQDWRPSPDLTRFTSTGTDTTITLEIVWKNDRVVKIREVRWYGAETGTDKEFQYGQWFVAGEPDKPTAQNTSDAP